MRAFIDGNEYSGTPDEVADFLERRENRFVEDKAEPDNDFTPFTSVVDESAKLRSKLAVDPAYNPFGGVIPGENLDNNVAITAPFNAESDTGVILA